MIETIVDGVLDILFRTVHILPETGLNSVDRTIFPLQHHGMDLQGLEINSIERKGAILKRKYNSLPEESQGRSTLEKVVIVGSVLVMAFAKLMSNDKKN
jgi:hypothetical protein